MIKNIEEVRDELEKMLMQYDIEKNKYQTDIYAYYNEETGNVTLDEFYNIGGCNWLDDDHITIYEDREHLETIFDFYENIESITSIIGDEAMNRLFDNIADEYEIPKSDITFGDIISEISIKEKYKDINHKLNDYYVDYIRHDIDYSPIIDEIIEQLEDVIEERKKALDLTQSNSKGR